MTHREATDEIIETAALYALGALGAHERAAFERHLAEGCDVCAREVRSLVPVAGALGHAAPPRPPRPHVRDRLLAGIREAAPTVVRADTGGWQPLAPGVEFRRLHRDEAAGTLTAVVRMAPGSRLPRHRHGTDEQLFMLSGDADVDGVTVRPGDYYRAAAGTVHDVTRTEGGCTFLLIASVVELLE